MKGTELHSDSEGKLLGSSNPRCKICLNSLTPLFPVETCITLRDETFSFVDVYASLTQINLDSISGNPHEVCLACFRSLVNAFIIVKEKSDLKLKDRNNLDLKGLEKNSIFGKPLIVQPTASLGISDFDNRTNKITNKITNNITNKITNKIANNKANNNLKDKNDLKIRTAKQMLMQRKQVTKEFIQKHKNQTIFRCRYCQNLFFDYEISAHAKICVDPSKSKLPSTNKSKDNVNSNLLNNSTLNDTGRQGIKKIGVKNNIPPKINKIPFVGERDPIKTEVKNDLLLLCKFCRGKLYMSEMEEHKKKCRTKKPEINNAEKGQPPHPIAQKQPEISIKKLNTPSKTKSYICQLCNKHCLTENLLIMHIMRHANENQKCKACPMRFKTTKLLVEHERKHYTQKRHCCQVCSKGFNSMMNLKSHMVSHECIEIQ